MRYELGNLILSDEDRAILEMATMNPIKEQYLASYFIGSMREIKAGAVEKIDEIKSSPYFDERSPIQLELLKHQMRVCDMMIDRGFEAAKLKNVTIQMQ